MITNDSTLFLIYEVTKLVSETKKNKAKPPIVRVKDT